MLRQKRVVKKGSIAYAGAALHNAITVGYAGDSIEHGQRVRQEMCNPKARRACFKKLFPSRPLREELNDPELPAICCVDCV
jgi:hypothetical protein